MFASLLSDGLSEKRLTLIDFVIEIDICSAHAFATTGILLGIWDSVNRCKCTFKRSGLRSNIIYKEGITMFFHVFNSEGDLLYEGYSWPMARAALDKLVLMDDGCPRLHCWSEPETEKEP